MKITQTLSIRSFPNFASYFLVRVYLQLDCRLTVSRPRVFARTDEVGRRAISWSVCECLLRVRVDLWAMFSWLLLECVESAAKWRERGQQLLVAASVACFCLCCCCVWVLFNQSLIFTSDFRRCIELNTNFFYHEIYYNIWLCVETISIHIILWCRQSLVTT